MLVCPLLVHHRWRAHCSQFSCSSDLYMDLPYTRSQTTLWHPHQLQLQPLPSGHHGQEDHRICHPNRATCESKHVNTRECYLSTRTTGTHCTNRGGILFSSWIKEGTELSEEEEPGKDMRSFFPVFQIYLTHGPSTITLCMSKRTTGGLFLKRQATCTSPKWSRLMWATIPAS